MFARQSYSVRAPVKRAVTGSSHLLSHVHLTFTILDINLIGILSREMADYNIIRSRQESSDESIDENSTSSAVSTEDPYSDIEEEKDGYDIDDFQMVKTIGKFSFIILKTFAFIMKP